MKKFFIFVVALIAAITYVTSNYTVQNVFDYAVKKNDPKMTPKIMYYCGYYLEMKDRHEEAIADLEALIEAYPENNPYMGDAIFHLGEAYENTRQKPKATELYTKYLEDYPSGPQADLAKRKLELFKAQ